MTYPPHVLGLFGEIDSGKFCLIGVLADAMEDCGEYRLAEGLRKIAGSNFQPYRATSGWVGVYNQKAISWESAGGYGLPADVFWRLEESSNYADWEDGDRWLWWDKASRFYVRLALALTEDG